MLVCKDAQLVSTAFTSFVATELAAVSVIFLQFFVTDIALAFIRVLMLSRLLKGKNILRQLKVYLFVAYSIQVDD